ncbi:phosphoribosyl-AMP cyclohydrolase [Alphaproteobacteria bacterium]|nr:phosphoribosyl-AMP cyclohydrolase [Alphaproteobacteria bacterium]
MNKDVFHKRNSVEQVEESKELAPRFNEEGLIPVVVTSSIDGAVLMLGFMNAEAFSLTVENGEGYYWSRSRQSIWRKGETSGLVHKIIEMRIDDDQDSVWLSVSINGKEASCHVGYRSCFYRSIPIGKKLSKNTTLKFVENKKIFDPKEVYGDIPNPTKL